MTTTGSKPNPTIARSVFDGSREPLVVGLDEGTVRVQFCLSPHCTTLASLLESTPGTWWSGPEDGWHAVVARRSASVDMSALAPYTAQERFPAFLTSSLRNPAPAFAEQVEEIRATPADQIRAEILELFPGEVPAVYEPFLERPRESTDRLCGALLDYWGRVVAPSWPTIRAFLEREILKQGYSLATRDTLEALNDVHPSIRVDRGALRVDSRTISTCGPLGDRGLMLTPLVSDRAGILADLNGSQHIKIGYAAPGAQEVWIDCASGSGGGDGDLAELLGASRAEIVRALRSRSTTTMLSRALRLAPATVSGHLAALGRLALVDRARVGRSVYYRLSERGEALIDLFEPKRA